MKRNDKAQEDIPTLLHLCFLHSVVVVNGCLSLGVGPSHGIHFVQQPDCQPFEEVKLHCSNQPNVSLPNQTCFHAWAMSCTKQPFTVLMHMILCVEKWVHWWSQIKNTGQIGASHTACVHKHAMKQSCMVRQRADNPPTQRIPD